MSKSDIAKAPDLTQVAGMVLLSLGLYVIVLGLTVPLALLSWPRAMEYDASFGLGFLAFYLLIGGSLLFLVSLLFLKVYWPLLIGVLVLALLAPYVGGWFPTYTYGGAVLIVGLIVLARVKGLWPTLWRTLLVTGASAAVIFAVAYGCGQVAAAGPGATPLGNAPPSSPVYPLASWLVGGIDTLIIVYWLTRRGHALRSRSTVSKDADQRGW